MKIAVIASLLLSILATILFFGQKLGISVFIFVLPLICFTIYFLEKHRKTKNRKAYLLAVPILLLSATYAIYQNLFFQVINVLVMIVIYLVMLITAMLEKYQLEFSCRRALYLMIKPFNYMSQTCKSIGKVFPTKKEKKQYLRIKLIKQIILGAIISIPILIIVISLLSSADITFAEETKSIFNFFTKNCGQILDIGFWFSLTSKLLVICALTLYFISFIFNILSQKPWKVREEKELKIQIETTILNTIVTILNVIYIIFCRIQIMSLINVCAGTIAYANYAREGFFQLMAVSVINFVIILITTKNEKQSSKAQVYYRKGMNLILAISTIIILISAFIRMNLYGEAYGYTFLRIYVYFALMTETILMFPTIIYILKDKFVPWKSYFLIVVTVYLVMNFCNIPHFIANKNIERYLKNNQDIDVLYLRKTKTDGIEPVIKLYENTQDEYLKSNLGSYLVFMKEQLEEKDNIIEWNYSKWNARRLLNNMNLEIYNGNNYIENVQTNNTQIYNKENNKYLENTREKEYINYNQNN